MTIQLHAGLTGLILAAISAPLLAENNVQLGVAASANTSFYEGVGEKYYAFPLVIAEYRRFYLKGVHGGYRIFQDETGQSLALEIRRTFDGYDSGDSDALAGMADREAAWEAGLAYEVGLAGGQAKAGLMHDIADTHKGFSALLEYERPFWTDNEHMLSWYTGVEYWSSKKTDYYFGVRAEEATSTRPAYLTDDSYGVYVGGNALKRLTDQVSLIVNVEYRWMGDTVDESPLTSKQDQWSAYTGIFYEF